MVDTVEGFLARSRTTFDLVFMDPPYPVEAETVQQTLANIIPRLSEGATVILQRRWGGEAPQAAGLELVDERRYGSTQIWRYEESLT